MGPREGATSPVSMSDLIIELWKLSFFWLGMFSGLVISRIFVSR